jgi:MtN3 and saliva related transmembrane protein
MIDSQEIGYLATLAGTIGGMLSVGAFLPQAWRIYRRRSAADVSLAMYLSIIVACVLWMFYAYERGAMELLITNLVIAVIAGGIVLLRIRYGDQ